MRKITFEPPAGLSPAESQWWANWTARANKAAERYVAAWEKWAAEVEADPASTKKPPGFNTEIWTEFKENLLKTVFGNKCAYCETPAPVRWPVQVEHYRPKGAVTYRGQGANTLQDARTLDAAGKERVHPGYFWLAYNWRNLLPCCSRCNSAKGKNTQFPVGKLYVFLRQWTPQEADERARAVPSSTWPGMFYPAPEDLDRLEDPMLLNPRIHQPADHITFGVKGVGAGITPLGVHTLKVFDLEDEDLRQARQQAQEDRFLGYLLLITAYTKTGHTLDEAQELALAQLRKEASAMEYSAAVFDGLPKIWKQMAPTSPGGG
jgi:hypothetical protein